MPEHPADALREYATLYPEVVHAGSLRDALQTAADRAGHALAVEPTSAPGWRHVAAQVEADGRTATVLMLRGDERDFRVTCRAHDIGMATGSVQDLSRAAGAVHTWIQGAGVRELTDRWPFLRTWELAEAHERGETEAIAVRWRMMQRGPAPRRDADFGELVRAAFEHRRLRALSPGRSMCWLTLSRSATYPVVRDFPRTRPLGAGRYEVMFLDRSVQEVDGATATVAVIVDNLPPDL
ncbi:DUF6193 family natural product biosynthesis protein [Kitasatospora sp. NPDC093550]|uniref:DUF6193 family natural product biosynthesis protein n=1 Tax=Kitasatospora sp. NPDC093550 TaxID=3364089 RepID=UPI00380E9D9F